MAPYLPGAAATISSVMLPAKLLRSVKPVPAPVTTLSDTPAPKSKSFVAVVGADPLFSDPELPAAAAVTSRGFVWLSPLYSWMYSRPNRVMALANVAVTVSAPPTTLLA